MPRFPDVEDPLEIAGELLVSAFRNKAYTVTDPCEVVVNAGDIKSVSIVEAGDQERAYKVRFQDDTVGFGAVKLSIDRDDSICINHFPWQVLAQFDSGGDYAIVRHGIDCELAFVSAIVRDLFVCEERERFYEPLNRRPSNGRPRKDRAFVIRYLPRVNVRYIGMRRRPPRVE